VSTDHVPPSRTRFHGRVQNPDQSVCAHPDCKAPAEFRAPASNRVAGHVGGWQWLCLDHVRAFNSGYNFFDGMSPDAISEAQSPLAGWAHVVHDVNGYRFNDPLNALHGKFGAADAFHGRRSHSGAVLAESEVKSLKVLGLDASATLATIRRAYKALVRQFHPDSNGGDRSHERKLQDVVQAYNHLKTVPAFKKT
jgi:hypothetical protein